VTRVQCFVLAGMASLGVLTATGCDDQAAKLAESRVALSEAIALLDQAEQGFAPEGEAEGYLGYRTKMLGQAEAKLDAILGQGGLSDPVMIAGAHELQAGVKVSLARVLADDADAAFVRINGQSTGLFSHLAAVEQINAVIVARGGDSASILKALEEGDDLIAEKKKTIAADLIELSAQREAATLNAEKHHSQASSHFTQAQEFESLAINAASDEQKLAAYTQDYQAQIAGQDAQRHARDEQIDANRIAEQLAALKTQVNLLDQMATQVQDLRSRVQQEGSQAARDVSTANSTKGLVVAGVQEEYAKVAAIYHDKVDAPLAAAADQVRSAIEHLDQAMASADRADRRALETTRAGAQVDLTRVLSAHAGYARDFAKITSVFTDSPAIAGNAAAGTFRSKQDKLISQAKTLSEQAKAAMDEGIESSDALADEAAEARTQTLRAYGARLN